MVGLKTALLHLDLLISCFDMRCALGMLMSVSRVIETSVGWTCSDMFSGMFNVLNVFKKLVGSPK